jgi:hypothetical protein
LFGFGEEAWLDELAHLYVMNWVFVMVLMMDCLLCLFKGYYTLGLLVTNP